MAKVYVLLRDSMSRGEGTKDVRTFQDAAKARAVMREQFDAELNDWQQWCDKKYLAVERSKCMSRSIYEKGEYIMNHVDWTITECEVE